MSIRSNRGDDMGSEGALCCKIMRLEVQPRDFLQPFANFNVKYTFICDSMPAVPPK